jgi:hypothetical protein
METENVENEWLPGNPVERKGLKSLFDVGQRRGEKEREREEKRKRLEHVKNLARSGEGGEPLGEDEKLAGFLRNEREFFIDKVKSRLDEMVSGDGDNYFGPVGEKYRQAFQIIQKLEQTVDPSKKAYLSLQAKNLISSIHKMQAGEDYRIKVDFPFEPDISEEQFARKQKIEGASFRVKTDLDGVAQLIAERELEGV